MTRFTLGAIIVLCACSTKPGAPLPSGPQWKGELPAGATVVSPEEYQRIGGEPLDPDAPAAEAERFAQDESEVAALIAANPELAALVDIDPRDAGAVQIGPDLFALPSSAGSFVVHGREFAVRALAASARSVETVRTQKEIYAELYEALPEADRSGFPALDAVPESAGQLKVLNQQLAAHPALAAAPPVITSMPAGWVPSPDQELGFIASTATVGDRTREDGGCGYLANGVHAIADWPLERYETSVKNQGARGTCSSFAVTAALETRLARDYGVWANLSEQAFYGRGKANWYPKPKSFGDGLTLESVGRSIDAGYAWSLESDLSYNPSYARLVDENAQTYTQSCVDVPAARCSDTNHQDGVVCTHVGGGTWCAAKHVGEPLRDLTITAPSFYGPGFGEVVSFWDSSSPATKNVSLQTLKQMLLHGDPVVIGISIDMEWSSELTTTPGYMMGSVYGSGLHAVLAVGWVDGHQYDAYNASMPQQPIVPDGGAFIVLKNSWGECWGDRGYIAAATTPAKERIVTAVRVKSLNVYAPKVTLSAPQTVITAGDLTVSVTVPAQPLPIKRLELYDGPKKISEHAGTASFTVPITQADEGVHAYTVKAFADQDYGRLKKERGAVSNTVKVSVLFSTPVISSFTATPAALKPDGGTVALAWTATGATGLSIDHGVGNVTDRTSIAVNVTQTTTFTLTASNPAGTASAQAAVTVAPPCAAPAADCDSDPLTCEANLGADATCGRCDVNCQGLGCNLGFCRSVALNPNGVGYRFAVGGGAVYTMRVNSSAPTLYHLIRIPADGSPEVEMFTENVGPGGLAVDDTYVYWGSYACADSPCTTPGLPWRILKKPHTAAAADPPTLVTRTAARPALLAQGSALLLWHSGAGVPGDVYYRPLNAPASDFGTKLNSTQEGVASAIVVTTDEVYWQSGAGLRIAPIINGVPDELLVGGVAGVTVDPNGPLAVDGPNLLFVRTGANAGLYRHRHLGGLELVYSTTTPLTAIGVAGGYAYFVSSYLNGHFYRVPLEGGTPVEIVDVVAGGVARIAGFDARYAYGISATGLEPLVQLPR